jgi:uncharacterized DUF497 family protein
MGRYRDIEWDNKKDLLNREKHGLPLIAAAALLRNPERLEMASPKSGATEARIIAIGPLRGDLVTCVYVWRGQMRRIISPRSASRRERRGYQGARQR